MHEAQAIGETPVLVFYLLDVSASMEQPLGTYTRLEMAREALREALATMLVTATQDTAMISRCLVGLYAYSTDVIDLLDGIQPLERAVPLLDDRLRYLRGQQGTETAKAFYHLVQVLRLLLPRLYTAPAPLIVHLTDGEYTGPDPEPLVRWLMQLRVADGHLLVQHIHLSPFWASLVVHPRQWKGVRLDTPLPDARARKLRAMSSPMPSVYLKHLREHMHVPLEEGAYMLFPGHTPEFLRFALGITPILGLLEEQGGGGS